MFKNLQKYQINFFWSLKKQSSDNQKNGPIQPKKIGPVNIYVSEPKNL